MRDAGVSRAEDRQIWDWARANHYTVLTADGDFLALAGETAEAPKVIHLERCDFPFRAIEELLRQNAIRIAEFEADPNARLLVLRR